MPSGSKFKIMPGALGRCLAAALGAWVAAGRLLAATNAGTLQLDSLPSARFDFRGPVGERVQANLDEWLLRAPQANPGMLEMFRLRDRQPAPQLVPWAGEFVGKYLISAVQSLRLTADPRLRAQIEGVVAQLIATQADDGYLGPFPKEVRLLKNWDLWGHYHVLNALLRWHEFSGDPAALAAARKAGDLVCRTYLDTGKRVFDAGDPEMNMAILTGLAQLYEVTGEPRYLRMVREVEKDWERAGNYLRAGLDGREFFQSPRPRWESLHDLQGLFELWRITGDVKSREAFEHHWRSIRRWDRRNTGGFSSGEQATGNPYAATAIETCCTVAWMTLTLDYLRLTGDARAADALELATLNAGVGAQHPSGRWWTYNTPMDGDRKASAHDIVFQARAGTPELNCCSVNGPRVLGLLGEWAVMKSTDGLVLNWLGSGTYTVALAGGGESVTLSSSDDAWRSGHTTWRIEQAPNHEFTLVVRIPGWARGAALRVNAEMESHPVAGEYTNLRRFWKAGDTLELGFELPLRAIAGANEAEGKVSLYRGPLLLAWDQAFNAFDEGDIPPVVLSRLPDAKLVQAGKATNSPGAFPPWVLVEVPAMDGSTVRLVDFASAGSAGERYRTWLPARNPPPPPAFTQIPRDGSRLAPGPTRFQWRTSRRVSGGEGAPAGWVQRIEFSANEQFSPLLFTTNVVGRSLALDTGRLTSTASPQPATCWWRVVTVAPEGETIADVPPARFTLDASAPPQTPPPEPVRGPNGEVIVHSLRDGSKPSFGEMKPGSSALSEATGTTVNGHDQMLRYAVSPWPEDDFSVTVRVKMTDLPRGRIGQVFSAWAAPMNDPLRLVIDGGKLYARIEAAGSHSTPGVPIEAGRWYAVAAVKRNGTLMLYLDGKAMGSCPAPQMISTQTADCALGGNPHYGGNEFLAATFADFGLFARALTELELATQAANLPSP